MFARSYRPPHPDYSPLNITQDPGGPPATLLPAALRRHTQPLFSRPLTVKLRLNKHSSKSSSIPRWQRRGRPQIRHAHRPWQGPLHSSQPDMPRLHSQPRRWRHCPHSTMAALPPHPMRNARQRRWHSRQRGRRRPLRRLRWRGRRLLAPSPAARQGRARCRRCAPCSATRETAYARRQWRLCFASKAATWSTRH